jgi:NCS2 family nucleobase:cation symporter-2
MALQHLAIQAIYFTLPVVVASALGLDARLTANFLCLSLLATVVLALAQVAWRGPVGSGYPSVSIPSPILVSVYLIGASNGLAHDQMAALLLMSGVVAIGILFLVPRPEAVFPSEIAGVVIFLLGASLVPIMLGLMTSGGQSGSETSVLSTTISLLSFIAMVVVALSRLRIAPFCVLIGGIVGVILVTLLLPDRIRFADVMGVNSWLALPEPMLPRFEGLSLGLFIMFVVPILPGFTSTLGNLVALQRASDAAWTKADGPPLRRGLMAFSLATFATGFFGGMAPSASTACTSLSIANRSLSRRIALAGAVMLCALAFSPKIAALFTVIPPEVVAAMLLYVAAIMLVTGCQLIVARMLDTRRTLVVGVGLIAGLSVLMLPSVFETHLPALASPLSFGSLVALLAHLLTLPLVARQASLTLPIGSGLPRLVEDEALRLGGAWGARRSTMQKVENFLIEMGEVMALREEPSLTVVIRHLEGEVSVVLKHGGAPLPAPSAEPAAMSLDGDMDQQVPFILWLATRQATVIERRPTDLRVTFNDS